VRFIVDAQLPRRIAVWLRAAGHDALHTLDLPEGNRTADQSIIELSLRDHRVVVTKDADFVAGFLLRGEPEKLLLVSTGNITNAELQGILVPNLSAIVSALEVANFVELSRAGVISHD
jgi:predicted nuclease of predicted toxin-antitoxin system